MIRQKTGQCRSIDVAYHLNVSKPSVSVAVANLEKMGLVVMEPTHELKLTRTGMRYAKRVLDRHRLLAAALTRLGVAEDIAEEDACRIEHDISQESYDALKAWYEGLLEREGAQPAEKGE
ncbi:MAG: metal-dependent transcriptional regulator [Clostridia bacterium]|nr:metal-dependent transcriptional regulator [Clostridia bacterium]